MSIMPFSSSYSHWQISHTGMHKVRIHNNKLTAKPICCSPNTYNITNI
nr:MAG TPA: hypothetical protein [Caudoviricetes sp.]